MNLHVGFTGTQQGMSRPQNSTMLEVLRMITGGEDSWTTQYSWTAHHGDCIGADRQFHNAARLLGAHIILHPPSDSSKRAFCVADESRNPHPYLIRNHHIVDESAVMIAAPNTTNETLRSGTWATARYASKLQRRIFLVYPDGTYEEESG